MKVAVYVVYVVYVILLKSVIYPSFELISYMSKVSKLIFLDEIKSKEIEISLVIKPEL